MKSRRFRTERGGVVALCEAVINMAVIDCVSDSSQTSQSAKDDARVFIMGGKAFDFYAQFSGRKCLKRAEMLRQAIARNETLTLKDLFPPASKKERDEETDRAMKAKRLLWAWQNDYMARNCEKMTAAELSEIIGISPTQVLARLHYRGLKCKRKSKKSLSDAAKGFANERENEIFG